MDTGEGKFKQFESMQELLEAKSKIEQLGGTVRGVFSVGDRVELRGSQFEVQEIWPKKLVLKLLS